MRTVSIGAALCCLLAGSSAEAIPLTVGGGWHLVEWNCSSDDVGSCSFGQPSDGVYTFELTAPGLLTFTDLFTAGDEFLLVVDAAPVATSVVPLPGYHPANCPSFGAPGCDLGFDDFVADSDRVARFFFEDGRWSTLQLRLEPGIHSVAFALTTLAPDVADSFPGDFQTVGLAAIQVTPVPEPATMWLLGTGLAAGAAARRRRFMHV